MDQRTEGANARSRVNGASREERLEEVVELYRRAYLLRDAPTFAAAFQCAYEADVALEAEGWTATILARSAASSLAS